MRYSAAAAVLLVLAVLVAWAAKRAGRHQRSILAEIAAHSELDRISARAIDRRWEQLPPPVSSARPAPSVAHDFLRAQDGDSAAPADHPLFGKTLCFTGGMEAMIREEACERVVLVGANFRENVSKHLDYLVLGGADASRFAGGWETGKLARAKALVAAGAAIEIISEDQFTKLLEAPSAKSVSVHADTDRAEGVIVKSHK